MYFMCWIAVIDYNQGTDLELISNGYQIPIKSLWQLTHNIFSNWAGEQVAEWLKGSIFFIVTIYIFILQIMFFFIH